MNEFDAYRIFEDDGKIEGRLVKATLDELTPGDVVIKAAYSSVNYKDALPATGAGKILHRFPLIGGIDVAGSVVWSGDHAFQEGDEVLVTGYDLSVSHDGGYAEYVRMPAEWVVPIPKGLSTFDVMAIGTAGFTAALSVVQMESNGLSPADGPVIVTGATGGVGSIAVDLLATLGYDVTALTGKDSEHDYLRSLGAKEVLSRHELEMGTRPLEESIWSGAVDPVGGDILAWLTRTMAYDGPSPALAPVHLEMVLNVAPRLLSHGYGLIPPYLAVEIRLAEQGSKQRSWARWDPNRDPKLPEIGRISAVL